MPELRSLECYQSAPLLTLAMSGGFIPITDPENEHSLAMLAQGVYRKGKEGVLVSGHTIHYPHVAYGYEPSWAKGSEAIAICEVHGRQRHLASLVLRYGGHRLSIAGHANSDDVAVAINCRSGDGPVDRRNFILTGRSSERLIAARVAIGNAAQVFYNRMSA